MTLGRALAIGGLAALGACGRVDLPDLSLIPGAQGKIEDRVWLDTDPAAPPGSLRAFLSDGTMILTSCGETYRLAPWRRMDATNVVWEEDGRTIRAEIGVLGPKQLALVLTRGAETVTRSFRAAEAPVVCPDLPR